MSKGHQIDIDDSGYHFPKCSLPPLSDALKGGLLGDVWALGPKVD